MKLKIADSASTQYDLVSLGEVMLRFDPGDQRIRNARSFRVWEGGGEYNVARGLKTCFGKKTAIVTALVDNEIGRLVQNRIREGGVDDSWIKWADDDGIGDTARNGLYFWESGFGIRGAAGASDRAHTAVSQLAPGDIDWNSLFDNSGVRWFHTGGIFAGLSEQTSAIAAEAMQAAKKYGAIVSYDLNYRPSVWKRRGGKKTADTINNQLLRHTDVLFGVESLEQQPGSLDGKPFRDAILKMVDRHPHLKVVASTMRFARNANVNDWSGLLWQNDTFYQGLKLEKLEMLDRVGGGDAFASGLIYGFLDGKILEEVIQYGVIHGALTMTTPGDNSMVSRHEVEAFLHARNPGISR